MGEAAEPNRKMAVATGAVATGSRPLATRNVTVFVSLRKRLRQEHCLQMTLSKKALCPFKMNRVMLSLIIFCGGLIILYANSDLLVRRSFLTLFPASSSRETETPPTYDKSATQPQSEENSFKQHMPSQPLILKYMRQLQPLQYVAANASRESYHHHDYNVFVIYTKESYQLHSKFELFSRSLLKHTSVPIHLHIITDEGSESSVEDVLAQQVRRLRSPLVYSLYDIHACSELVADIVHTMRPFFSASPKSYYSDTLFFLSLGLHRIADARMERAVLLDCDIVFRADIRLLVAEVDHFSAEHLFGLAPELTPVYRHILYRYRANFPGSNFGSPYYPAGADKSLANLDSADEQRLIKQRRVRHGYPGLNSGVVLLHLNRIRASQHYRSQLKESHVRDLAAKYAFKGHLGDQDFYTLLGYEFPNLIYRLDCIWNRQLCTWWKDHGYSDVFDAYFHCEGRVRMYHGNCNTRVPE